MGLKLKTQIAGILFLLFTLTVVILGYFNMSILYDVLRSLTQEQSLVESSAIASWAQRNLPVNEPSAGQRSNPMQQRELTGYLSHVHNLRAFRVLDLKGNVVWQFGHETAPFSLESEAIKQVLSTGQPFYRLWEYAPGTPGHGQVINSGSSLLLSDDVTYHFYRIVTVPEGGVPAAVVAVTLNCNEMPRQLRLMLVGNVLLSLVFLLTAFVAISIWTSNAINRPLEFILAAQERIGKGDFSAHVSVDIPSTNEIVRISSSFNHMAAELRSFRKELEIKTALLEELNGEYRRLNEHLETKVEDKTRELKEFFQVVTHDMKVPLAAIQGYVDLLGRTRGEALGEKQQRFVAGISGACAHLLGLVRNMLESVKYDAGKTTYYIEDFSLSALIDEVTLQVGHQAEDRKILLRFDVPPLCRDVSGDSTKITQVVLNLVNNALKFTPEGGTIEVRARDRGAFVEVEVADTGQGIAPEQIPHLFEKFTQFHTQEGASSSIGLGLYIVKKILEGHGQGIRVTSTPGQGSAFIFTLAKGSQAGKAESLDHLGAVQEA